MDRCITPACSRRASLCSRAAEADRYTGPDSSHGRVRCTYNLIRPGTLGPPCERPGIPGGGAAERERRAHRSSSFRAPRLPFFFAAMATSDLAPRRFAPPAARPCRPSHFAVSVLCRDVRLPSRFDAPRGPAAPTPRAFQGFYSLLFLLSIRCPSPRISSFGRPGSPRRGLPGRLFPRSTAISDRRWFALTRLGPAV